MPRGNTTRGRRPAVRDEAWRQGRVLGIAQPVSGCGCEASNESAGARLAQDREHAPCKPSARHTDAWTSLRHGLELLLQHFAYCLRDLPAVSGGEAVGSRQEGSRSGPTAISKPSAGRSASLGAPSSLVGYLQAVFDVVWGMAVLRPKIRTARFVMRSLPRWRQLSAHRRVAKQLMPHWFPVSV